jgi:hypothetical protein
MYGLETSLSYIPSDLASSGHGRNAKVQFSLSSNNLLKILRYAFLLVMSSYLPRPPASQACLVARIGFDAILGSPQRDFGNTSESKMGPIASGYPHDPAAEAWP